MKDYLTNEEEQRLDARRREDPFASEVWEQVNRILASARFERLHQRACDFLRFVTAKTLLGEADQIKETTVAIAVFGEPADFDPSETSKIRVAAADLRARLSQYAQNEGAADALAILIPTNTYVPEIIDRLPTVELLAFDNWSACDNDGHLRDAFVAELSKRLAECKVRVSRSRTSDFGCVRRRFLLNGSFVCSKDVLYITASLCDPEAQYALLADTFRDERDSILKLGRVVAEHIFSSLNHTALLA